MTKSKKYVGVYYREKKDGDVTYYFTFQNENKKTEFQKVGTKNEGVTESYVNDLRLQTIIKIRNGELPPKLVTNKKRYNITVDEIANFYFTQHITSSTQKRQRQYNYRLKSFFWKMSIFNVNSKHLNIFRDITLKEVSEQTTIIYIELLSTIFNFYIKNNNLKLINPILYVNKPKINNIRERILTREEIRLLFYEIEHDFTLCLFLSLSLCTGGRKSTIMHYSIKDVDLTNKCINSFDFKNNTTYKSFLDDRTIELIKIRTESSTSKNDKLVYKENVHDLDRWLGRKFKVVFDSLFNVDLERDDRKNRVVMHTLRHTVLSHLGMKGYNAFLIKKISNHKSIKMVQRYVKLHEKTG